ncbi:MAG: carboxypeptidase-like regulatory domain-containing protein [Bacteroidales bacterium]|nr:carboxypeptidase-like regulatory domain-containing protein [Bacteroidales bacterium]
MKYKLLIITFFFSIIVNAQNITQTVKGKVVDKETMIPLPGTTIIIENSNPQTGTITDETGYFTIKNVPTGRQTIIISFIGYETCIVKNILVTSGKQIMLSVELIPRIEQLDQIIVTADKEKPINSNATVSARQFRVEETEKYAASFSDPGRMAQSFAGVMAGADYNNEIIIRGNSSRGLLWQLEGIEIPPPNHLHMGEGSSAGALSIISNTVLANSDFFTGAFPAEYGNAISGVFDLKFRNGNFYKREYTFQAGLGGLQVALEGPFVKGKKMSYLFNYRYSTVTLLSKLKLIDFGEVTILPNFQDINYKLFFDTKKAGTFSIFGLAGNSYIGTKIIKDSTQWEAGDNSRYNNDYFTNVTGASHRFIFRNGKSYIKSAFCYSNTFFNRKNDTLDNDYQPQLYYEERFKDETYSLNTFFNHRFNLKNILKFGAAYSILTYSTLNKYIETAGNDFTVYVDETGQTSRFQNFLQWKHKFSDKMTLISGLHFIYFLLNNNYSVEPRLGFEYKLSDRFTLTYGFGKHSRTEPISIYFSDYINDAGEIINPNKNLKLLNSIHNIAGLSWKLNKNTIFKTEIYHQYLYNVPVIADSLYFSTLNMRNANLYGKKLCNEGIAYNTGIELTLEQFLTKGFYYLITASIFNSKYKSLLENKWRNTIYNSNYMLNIVSGKEFTFSKNRLFGVSSKLTLRGGFRLTPVDLEESKLIGNTVYIEDKAYEEQAPDYFRLDINLRYTKNKPKYSWSLLLEIQNITNRKNLFKKYYNSTTQNIETIIYEGIIPNLNFRIEF